MSGFDITKVLGAGTDTIDKGVLGMPFIQIIQSGSPETNRTHAKHEEKKIPGSQPGDIFFVPTRKVLTQPLCVIPLAFHTLYTEWKPRNQGGGIVGNQPLGVVTSRGYRKGAAGTPDQYKEWLGDNELKLTVLTSVQFLNGTEWVKGLISFNSTQLKPARLWQKHILNLRYPDMPDAQPPVFCAMWKLSTEPDSNDQGGWFGWSIVFDHMLDPVGEQALLESAFTGHQAEQIKLPSTATPALTEGESKDVPY